MSRLAGVTKMAETNDIIEDASWRWSGGLPGRSLRLSLISPIDFNDCGRRGAK